MGGRGSRGFKAKRELLCPLSLVPSTRDMGSNIDGDGRSDDRGCTFHACTPAPAGLRGTIDLITATGLQAAASAFTTVLVVMSLLTAQFFFFSFPFRAANSLVSTCLQQDGLIVCSLTKARHLFSLFPQGVPQVWACVSGDKIWRQLTGREWKPAGRSAALGRGEIIVDHAVHRDSRMVKLN